MVESVAYKKSELSTKQIVDAAITVLAKKGYAQTSLLDIATQAGMSKGAVHYHFPTKEALIDVVLETACTAVQQRTIAAWSTQDNPFESLRKSLNELWQTRAERTDEALVVADLLAQSLYNERLRPRLAEYYRLAADQINQYLQDNFYALGASTRIAPELLPRIVIGLLDGLVMQAFVEPDAFGPDDVVDAIEALAMGVLTLERAAQ